MRLSAVWGTVTGLLRSDARVSDLGSILRDVTASTKRPSSHSKAAGPRNQRLCLVPHTCRILGQRSLGIEPAVKCSSLHLVPTLAFHEGGRPSDKPKLWTCDGFFAASFRVSRFRCGKRKASTPLPMCVEAKMARFSFLPMPLGDGTAKARALTTLPADAHNVTQSRKICGSPRFALFSMTAP